MMSSPVVAPYTDGHAEEETVRISLQAAAFFVLLELHCSSVLPALKESYPVSFFRRDQADCLGLLQTGCVRLS